MKKSNIIIISILSILVISVVIFQFVEINKIKTTLNSQSMEINKMTDKITKTNERISIVISNWVRTKGDEASCNNVCQKQNLECVFGQITTNGKSDDNKIIDCSEDYSNAEWLKPYTLNCLCRQK